MGMDDRRSRQPHTCPFGEFRRSVETIRIECRKLGVDPSPSINPSPFGDTSTLGPFEKGTAFPPFAEMLRQIEAKGKEALLRAGVPLGSYSIQAPEAISTSHRRYEVTRTGLDHPTWQKLAKGDEHASRVAFGIGDHGLVIHRPALS
jgi:hypothetical protein